MLAAFALALSLSLQESRPTAASQSRPNGEVQPKSFTFLYDSFFPRVEGAEVVLTVRNPELRTGALVASADRAVAFFDQEGWVRWWNSSHDETLDPGPEIPSSGSRDLLAEMKRRALEDPSAPKGPILALRDAPSMAALRAVYLEGDVRVREGTSRSARFDSMLFDVTSGRLLFINGEVRLELPTGGRPIPLTVRAEIIRQEVAGVAQATDADLTTCGLAVPHYHIHSADLTLQTIGTRDLAIDATTNRLDFTDAGSVPIPDLSLYSTDLRAIPFESLRAGHSRRDGAFVRARVGSDFRDVGNDFNRSIGVDGEFRGHWSVELGALGRRGGSIEGTVTYETPGAYRGKTTGFYLADHGTNVGFLSDVYDESSSNRGRIHSENRIFAGSERTWVDVEVAHQSDPLLRTEFFPEEFKTERRPETDVYYRTAGDSLSFTSLVKGEVDKFEPVVDTGVTPGGTPPSTTNSYPFLDGRFYSAPIAKLGMPAGISGDAASRDLELVYRARVDAGYLEQHFADAELQPNLPPFVKPFDQRAARFDTVHELSTPFSFDVAKLTPFVEGRVTTASASQTDSEEITRVLGTVGTKIGTHLDHDYGGTRHIVDGVVTYRNQTESGDDGSEFIPFDEVDPLTRTEVVEFDLRNRFSRRDSDTGMRMTFADIRVTLPYYPSPARDNGGNKFGDLRPDARFDFGKQFVVPDLRVRSRARIDSTDFSTHKSDTAVIVSPFGPDLDFSVAYRGVPGSYSALSLASSYRIGRKWDFDVLEQFDLQGNSNLQTRVLLHRYGHDFALEISFTFDSNDNSQSVAIAISPLVGGSDKPRDRFFVPEPLFRGFY